MRDWKVNVFYGDGARQTVWRGRACLPARDVDDPAHAGLWYSDTFVVRGFSASGDTRLGDMEDSPGMDDLAFANPAPKPGPPTTTGRVEFVQASVAYLSARDTRATGAAGFQHLAHVLWRIGMSGVFDSNRSVGSRILRTDGGKPTHGKPVSGTSSQFPPILTGDPALNTVAWVTE